jgi:hypothetical protein
VLVYRVFPYLRNAADGEPGHPLYLSPNQGTGRWDNRDLYLAMYAAATPSGSVGEAFAHLSTWSAAMLRFPRVSESVRSLAVYSLDEEAHPILDLDNAKALLDRGLRPTDVVIRNRPRTQQLARDAFTERKWAGLGWWSMHRPQWALFAYWDVAGLTVERVEPLAGHPAVPNAARLLGKPLSADLAAPV